MKNVLITGGSGFLGRNLTKKLKNKKIFIYDTAKPNYKCKFIKGSILNISKINQKLKADISLFKSKNEFKTDFLEKEPISIGYYNELKDEVIWDFEYNRSMVEKIIHTMTKE